MRDRTALSARTRFDMEAIYKLAKPWRYFNISVLWIAYYPYLTRLLYYLRVRHEAVTVLSLVFGLSGAAVLWRAHSTAALVLAALLIHFKDALDACDGSLARLTGTGHRVGRFLDTIGDGIAYTALIGAVAGYGIARGLPIIGTLAWATLTWVSLFLQCSYFNYYQLRYTEQVGGHTLSRLDERADSADTSAPGERQSRMLGVLQPVYNLWFGWQDYLIERLDRAMRRSARLPARRTDSLGMRWYATRGFLVANSALCYGTHAFVLILCVLAGRPLWFFPTVGIGMNLYFAVILTARWIVFRRMA